MENNRSFEKNAMEAAIRIAAVAALVIWTYQIVRPFLMPLIWGVIIAIAVDPFVDRVAKVLGNRRKLAAILFGIVILVTLVVPVVMFSTSTIQTLQPHLKEIHNLHFSMPPPPKSLKELPVIGPEVTKLWSLASENLGAILKQFEPQLKATMLYLIGMVGGGVKAVFLFIVAIIVACALLANAKEATDCTMRIICRFSGTRGPEIASLATATIRAVMLGVVGVAIIQSVLAAIGMIVMGVPLAGLWAVLVLVCAVLQLPPILVLGPVAGWVFTRADTTPAVIFLVWCLIVSASDSLLKPLLMGRGVRIPMLVILLGALGGMMVSGIVGLFLGAVIVAISYELFMAWVKEVDIPQDSCTPKS